MKLSGPILPGTYVLSYDPAIVDMNAKHIEAVWKWFQTRGIDVMILDADLTLVPLGKPVKTQVITSDPKFWMDPKDLDYDLGLVGPTGHCLLKPSAAGKAYWQGYVDAHLPLNPSIPWTMTVCP